MNKELSSFAARLRELISNRQSAIGNLQFSELALELFALQFKHNPAYQKICVARRLPPEAVTQWTQIPAVPAAAFKELELTSIPSQERTAVFHSSGTTGQQPSRHFHNAASLAVYEASLWNWFASEVLGAGRETFGLVILTPPPAQVPQSSLVHMFETVRRKLDAPETVFVGELAADGIWTLDFKATHTALADNSKLKTQN